MIRIIILLIDMCVWLMPISRKDVGQLVCAFLEKFVLRVYKQFGRIMCRGRRGDSWGRCGKMTWGQARCPEHMVVLNKITAFLESIDVETHELNPMATCETEARIHFFMWCLDIHEATWDALVKIGCDLREEYAIGNSIRMKLGRLLDRPMCVTLPCTCGVVYGNEPSINPSPNVSGF